MALTDISLHRFIASSLHLSIAFRVRVRTSVIQMYFYTGVVYKRLTLYKQLMKTNTVHYNLRIVCFKYFIHFYII